jgi:quercetin dioxygenase-like cupin family protein
MMHISNLEKLSKIRPDMAGAEGVYKQVPISKEHGAPHFSFRVFTIEPGGHTPYHTHAFEHENYIIDGQGVILTGDQEHPIKKGDFVLVLPGEKHQYRNTSASQNMVMICAVPKEYE